MLNIYLHIVTLQNGKLKKKTTTTTAAAATSSGSGGSGGSRSSSYNCLPQLQYPVIHRVSISHFILEVKGLSS